MESKIERIKAALAQHITEAEKSTGAKWDAQKTHSFFSLEEVLSREDSMAVVMSAPPFALGRCGAIAVGESFRENAAFIATARTMSPAACKGLLVAIDALQSIDNGDSDVAWKACDALAAIEYLFPEIP